MVRFGEAILEARRFVATCFLSFLGTRWRRVLRQVAFIVAGLVESGLEFALLGIGTALHTVLVIVARTGFRTFVVTILAHRRLTFVLHPGKWIKGYWR